MYTYENKQWIGRGGRLIYLPESNESNIAVPYVYLCEIYYSNIKIHTDIFSYTNFDGIHVDNARTLRKHIFFVINISRSNSG